MPEAAAGILNFLKEPERYELSESAPIFATWGEAAPEVRQSSYLRGAAEAAGEAARQQAFTGQALAEDAVRLAGVHLGLAGKTITVTSPFLDYAAGRSFLVVGVEVDFEDNATILSGFTVL